VKREKKRAAIEKKTSSSCSYLLVLAVSITVAVVGIVYINEDVQLFLGMYFC